VIFCRNRETEADAQIGSGQGLDYVSKPLLPTHLMSVITSRLVSLPCVPVSITETIRSNHETRVPALKIDSLRQMRRLVGALVHDFGWTLGQDGNLYSPNPSDTAWGERVN
jgi:hypothetical protein